MRDPALTARIVTLRSDGLSWAQIAARVGISRAAVRERYLKATSQDALHVALARAERAEGEVTQLRKAMQLAEHKIDQTMQGQYPNGDALSVALWTLRDALALVSLPDNVAEV